MERELIAEQIERIYEVFPERPPMLTLKQAAGYLHRDARTLMADRRFPIKRSGRYYLISTVNLARWMLN
jgi:Rad3-related DNA helicase